MNWPVKASFHFPSHYGKPVNVHQYSVVPRFEKSENDDEVLFHGIYHVSAHVTFEEAEHEGDRQVGDFFVEDMELADQVGYFEYAIPFEIAIPSSNAEATEIDVSSVIAQIKHDALVEFDWEMNVHVPENATADEVVQDKVEEKEIAKKSFLFEKLKETYSKFQIK